MRGVVAAVLTLVACSAACAAEPPDGSVQLLLDGAAWLPGKADQKTPLPLRLLRHEGQWDPIGLCTWPAHSTAAHQVAVLQAASEKNVHKLRVRVVFVSDPWIEMTGEATYLLEVRIDGRHCAGTWSGTCRGAACQGELRGDVTPIARREGFQAPAPGEHPRLLLRRADLPALRQKAATAWGKTWLERIQKDTSSPAAQGFAYVITGDKAHAAKAIAQIERALDQQQWYHTGVAHAPAFAAVEHLIAYDLVYDACPQELHRRMRAFLRDKAEFFYWGVHNGQYNPSPTGNWSLIYRSGCGLIALSLLDEPAEDRAEPAKPQVPHISAPREHPAGIPLSAVRDKQPLEKWVFLGPVDEPAEREAWQAGKAADFQPLPDAVLKDGVIDLAALTKRTYCRAVYLYCLADVAQAGHYRLETTRRLKALRYTCARLGGQFVRPGEMVRLEAGQYPLLVRLWPEPVGNWEPLTFSATLAQQSEEQAQAWLASGVRMWQAQSELAPWRKSARRQLGMDPDALRWARCAALSAEGYFTKGLGDFGWNQEGEAYTRHAVRAAMPFALCYRNTFGYDIPGAERLGMMLALATAATIFSDRGAAMQSYNVGGGPMDVDLFARGFAFVPEKQRPGVLWAWNRSIALAAAGRLKDPHDPVAGHDGLSKVMMFLNWPEALAERNPADTMDRVVVDRQKGGYVFRNRWQDGDDCVVSVFANDNQAGGSWTSCEGGTFRINALGAAFAVRGQGYGNGGSGRELPDFCLHQNMVDVAEHHIGGSPQAKTVCFEPQQDGSGVVGLNMDEIYIHHEKQRQGRNNWATLRTVDLGIRARRCIAVDYSGRSGAPCLVAVADRLTGTKGSNTWQMSTEGDHAVTVAGNTFTIKAGNGAALRGTIVSPAGAAARVAPAQHIHEINYHGVHKRAVFPRKVILVDGQDRDQEFLVVMTIQKGDAPAVKSEVVAGERQVTVGDRQMRYDGQRMRWVR